MSGEPTTTSTVTIGPWTLPAPLASVADQAKNWGIQATSSAPLPNYAVDAWQRSILFLDLLRQRGNEQKDMTSRPMSTVLTFDHEILVSGRSLDRPINYSLSRIIPPEGTVINPSKRPVVVVDPRAGQGPGIGGFKTSSEIGDALANGHAVYFIGFSAQPEPNQTFLDVVEGQVKFFEHIVRLHPDAPRPFAIGNCQAGYQTLMVAMLRPDLFGPTMVAGSPMSYWQGEHGKNPMRYAGGLLGGSWITELVSDLTGGKFDGTWLILNFDGLNPANWLWSKQYDVYANIDTDGPRYLGFEKWWGDFIFLNGGEIQYLVDEMFIGDKLTRNELRSSDGKVFDLRNITSPIIVFTSLGDNISPPPQTLGWILDLYKDVDDMRAQGRTVVYCMNQKVGHLAIFVSAKVGAKEDEEMVRLMNFIDCLPPGLFELVITPASEEDIKAGKPAWHSRFEMRTFDDLRAYGRNTPEDDRAFAAVKRLSEINHSLYRTFLRPAVKAFATPQLAQFLIDANPLRLSYTLFADSNPFMKPVAQLAEKVREQRVTTKQDNPLLAFQQQISDQINNSLNLFRDARDRAMEQTFFGIFGSPQVQGLLGLNDGEKVRELPAVSPQALEERKQKAERIASLVHAGGFNEALIRSVLYVLSAERVLDERAAEALNIARKNLMDLSVEDFKSMVREQFFMILLDEHQDKAIDALSDLVTDKDQRQKLLNEVVSIASAQGALSPAAAQRTQKIAQILDVNAPKGASLTLAANNSVPTNESTHQLAPAGE
ncbi:DUF3141 domain-containing protein [Xanthobacter sp. TB0136]|uniref:DUF3141 domain-containing protein n=1 Tax=Xanthobacter sp. TB0136 TaxID=3459177 RepID=UPI0040397596